MNDNKTHISLGILLLNDLLRSKAIDQDTYNKAIQKLSPVNK